MVTPSTLRRTLGLAEVVGVALAMMGPTTTMAIGTALVVKPAGSAAPLAFLIGLVAVAIVGSSFALFGRRIATAGSARDYVASVFGHRCGFMAGWALFLTYATYTAGISALTGGFAAATLQRLGAGAPWGWTGLGIGAEVLAAALCLRDMRVTGRTMLALEWGAMLALLILAVVILRSVPLTWAPFRPTAGPGWSGIGDGLVFAVLAFAGFEGAAALGEEARDPHRVIPVAILGTVGVAGTFYVLLSYAQVVGFGPSGMRALASDPSPLATLSGRFLSPRFAVLVDVAATISSFSLAAGTLAAASRILLSLSRSATRSGLSCVSRAHGVPDRAIVLIALLSIVAIVAVGGAARPVEVFGDFATVGTLSLILVYMAVTGAAFAESFRERRLVGTGVGLLGLLLLLWPLANSLDPVPAWPDDLWPYLVVAWLGVGLLLLVARPEWSLANDGP